MRITNMQPIRKYDDEEAFLAAVVAKMRRFIKTLGARDEFSSVLADVAEHILLKGSAKLARPRLVYRFSQLLGGAPQDFVDLGVATEYLHVASLLHDDVIDQAKRRRGLQAANQRWSDVIAVLGGDALLCEGLRLIGDYHPGMSRRALDLVDQMTRGIIMEIEVRGRVDITLKDWRKIAAAKTAALFAWCGWAPAFWLDAPGAGARLERCGYHLGIAFQLADDLLDFSPEDQGKPRFADLRARFPSSPIILAAQYSSDIRRALHSLWQQEIIEEIELARVGVLMSKSGAMEQIVRDIEAECSASLDALGEFSQDEVGQEITRWIELISLKSQQTLNLLREDLNHARTTVPRNTGERPYT